MKKYLRISIVFAALLGAATIAQGQKFGYLNSAAILAEMPEVKQADANLEALQKQLQKKGQDMLEKLQQDYMTVQQKMERGELSPKQQEEEARRLKEREMEVSQFEQDMMKQIQDKRNSLLEPIYNKVNEAIQEVAKENTLTMVFDQSVLLFADPTQDISSMVKTKLGIVN
jgi:outer membrane protein